MRLKLRLKLKLRLWCDFGSGGDYIRGLGDGDVIWM